MLEFFFLLKSSFEKRQLFSHYFELLLPHFSWEFDMNSRERGRINNLLKIFSEFVELILGGHDGIF